MNRKTVILVDGENISAKHAEQIFAISGKIGTVTERKVYHHQKDQATRKWTEISKEGNYKDICLFGPPAKNKVDRKMQKDARAYMKRPDVDTVCIVTSDGGFRCLTEDAATSGKKLCFIGGKKTSKRLRKTGAQFMRLK